MSSNTVIKKVALRLIPVLMTIGLLSWCTSNRSSLYQNAPAAAEIRDLFAANGFIDGQMNNEDIAAVAKKIGEPGMNRLLYEAAPNASLPVLKWLVAHGAVPKDIGAMEGLPLLHRAALTPRYERMEYLLSLGLDPLQRSRDGSTLMHYAAQGGLDERTLSLLISKGLNINETNAAGKTPMHFASVRSIQVLAAAGADIDPKDNQGRTPLHQAAQEDKNAVVSELLLHNASVFATDDKGRTPLHLAAMNRRADQVIETLLAAGAPKAVRDNDGMTPRDLAEIRDENYQSSSIIDKL